MESPTFLTQDKLWHDNKSHWFIKRATEIGNFIDEVKEPVADLGVKNPLIDFLNKNYNFNANSIENLDFDYDKIDGKYGTIFFFAILEHIFNPLFALENIKKALLPGGIIYLSTPYRPHFMWTEHHFHEIDDKRIKWLFKRAGLEIIKMKKIQSKGKFYQHLRGIRPLIRYFHKSMRLYKLTVKE